ncbi:hypothetical protein [Psychroserpens luteus]|uniref:Beta-lactamase-inhibitor-like, PepSY-like n=1 Tax=Psychroserpens luteus TaxID=1434066 RepID=A0ABW5ZWS2_9FLAO|nr:hypothetical protein [Psychroserpens luteus]
MKSLKQISFSMVMLILMASFSQCSTAQKLQEKAPTQFGDVYFQKWTAGVKGGGSGLNLFVPVKDKSVRLDSAYFRGKAVKFEIREANEGLLYVGRFKTEFNQPKQDMIMSSDPNKEYGNQLQKKTSAIPFELKDDECVVSYIKDGKILYYKISNVNERESLNYPSAPPNKNIKIN